MCTVDAADSKDVGVLDDKGNIQCEIQRNNLGCTSSQMTSYPTNDTKGILDEQVNTIPADNGCKEEIDSTGNGRVDNDVPQDFSCESDFWPSFTITL